MQPSRSGQHFNDHRVQFPGDLLPVVVLVGLTAFSAITVAADADSAETIKALRQRLGKFKSPIGLEQLQADASLPFNERSLVTDLVPNRDVGVQLWGEVSGGLLSYALGIFNGVGDARNSSNVDFDDTKAFEGRLFLQPFRKNVFFTRIQLSF